MCGWNWYGSKIRVLIVSFISYNLKNFSEGNDSEETRVSMFFNFSMYRKVLLLGGEFVNLYQNVSYN